MMTAATIGLPPTYKVFRRKKLPTQIRKIIRSYWRDTYGDNCLFCDKPMIFSVPTGTTKPPLNYATIDHINAQALGGTHSLDNIQVICAKCNTKKSILETLVSSGIY